MAKERSDLKKYVGQKLTIIAWLWARTVKSPNPAFANIDVPLASTFMLSTKAGKEAYVEPVIENGGYRFTVKVGKPRDAEVAKSGTKLARANFLCLMSGAPISGDYIKAEGKAGRMGARMMAIVAAGERGRVYLAPSPEHEAAAREAKPTWRPEGEIATRMTGGNCTPYGFTSWGDIFTPRQLVALTTFSDLVQEAREQVKRDAIKAGLPDDGKTLEKVGAGATAYADAVGVYAGITVSRQANRACTISFWDNTSQKIQQAFGRQALPMTWDFCESNPFSNSSGNWLGQLDFPAKCIDAAPAKLPGFVLQQDAQQQGVSTDKVVSTDPPYYDNIGYADLSDFFYVWLRRSLKFVFPDLFATLAVPKAEELVATPYRHGSKQKAEAFFLNGMTQAMHRLAEQSHPAFPVTIYYAFKQAESDGGDGTTNTGWDTFLAAVIEAGFAISGTWPMRTELTGNLKKNVAALASSIILVCRPRAADAPTTTRREFVTTLKAELPIALAHLQRGNIAPVDLAQAAIGPGMAIYTRYARVLDAEGQPLAVREALSLINQTLDEALAEQEGDFDADSRWALTWFEQSGFTEGEYGMAEQLSKSKNTSVAGMVEAGILASSHGKVRLLRPEELPADWDPTTDERLTAWEGVHHLIRILEAGGEGAAAALVAKLGAQAEIARELAYRLYTLCERKKRAAEALSYNGRVQSWPEITRLAGQEGKHSDAVSDEFVW
jgi:putative DNA methylase